MLEKGKAKGGLDFAAALSERAASPDLRKVERTRLTLLAALAAELLAGAERGGLKVSGVTRAADLAHGTFYRYFPEMGAALEALVEEFSAFLEARLAGGLEGAPGSRERVKGTMLLYTRLFAANAGLMRCLIGLGNDSSAFARSYQALNRAWYRRMAAAMARGRAAMGLKSAQEAEDLLPTAYALGGMVDDFLAQLFLRHEPALAALGQDEEAVAELLTDLWWRAAYGRTDQEGSP
ncbi:TetR/AcrR family transcriptional regulator [Afifella pfennigii]|uniref:TetR/AcrR family transcriptional regulator n=1 Tax=Afifella pfennigii TaxID=209897 RepID=UPI00047CA89D|nr:TetR/AcrR family transcriptional regulator [Afifella pfennigii]